MSKAKGTRLSLSLPTPLNAENKPTAHEGAGTEREGNSQESVEPAKGTFSVVHAPPARPGAQTPPLAGPNNQAPLSPHITSLPSLPHSPAASPKAHNREPSRSFLSNIRAAKPSAKIPGSDPTIRPVGASTVMNEGRQIPQERKASVPSLPSAAGHRVTPSQEELRRPNEGLPEADLPLPHRFGGHISDSVPSSPVASTNMGFFSSASAHRLPTSSDVEHNAFKKPSSRFNFMRRAPSHQSDDSAANSSHDMKPPSRDRSGNRPPVTQGELAFNPLAANDPKHLVTQRSGFLKAIKTGANKTYFGIKKQTDKYIKGSKPPQGMPPLTPQVESNYVCTVLNLPLRDQVRVTRIAPRLEVSRDKTEFWLPALPWRCIDYLNYKGVEEQGIYRLTGAVNHVKYYKQKFDQFGDVNLYNETELYDVNIIASLLKQWLRDLPDDIFPKELQHELMDKYEDSDEAPEELKHVISQLPPWQYYLLFAITCHLNLIAASSDKNLMTIDNLFTCIGSQALRVEARVFGWLVGDWRKCWIGCKREKEYLEEEYAWLDDQERKMEPSDPQQPPWSSSSSKNYPESAFEQHQVHSEAAPPGGRPVIPPRPSESALQGRLGSSGSRSNIQISPPNQRGGDEHASSPYTEVSSVGLPSLPPRITGNRKPAQPDFNPASRSQTDVSQPRSQTQQTRERSPLGRRPAARPIENHGSSHESESHSRTRSQPRNETRGKSPSSHGRRRREHNSPLGNRSPANDSSSQNSDAFFAPQVASGMRKRSNNSEATSEIPALGREQREKYDKQGLRADQEGTQSTVKEGKRRENVPAGRETENEWVLVDDHTTSSNYESQEPYLLAKEPEEPPQLKRFSFDTESYEKHTKTDSQSSHFRLSEPKFPEPISPTYRGMMKDL